MATLTAKASSTSDATRAGRTAPAAGSTTPAAAAASPGVAAGPRPAGSPAAAAGRNGGEGIRIRLGGGGGLAASEWSVIQAQW